VTLVAQTAHFAMRPSPWIVPEKRTRSLVDAMFLTT